MVCCSRKTGSQLLSIQSCQNSNADIVKAIVVFPTSSKSVLLTVEFIIRKTNLPLAVCGGRHSTNGSSSTDGGVCIDLRKMNQITVDPKKRLVTAEGGCLWSEVDEAVKKQGLAVVGGTV